MISLKKLLTHQNKYVILPIAATVFMCLYSIAGAIGHRNGEILEMTDFEQAIPLMEWTIWIYIILYPAYIVWAILSYKNIIQMNKTLYSFFTIGALSCATFLIYPVSYPRDLYPLSQAGGITTALFEFTRMIDKPSNCLPSLHVGLCFMFAFGFLKECPRKFALSIFISFLIAISTLTTKQHYIVDLIASLVLTIITYIIIQKQTKITQS